VLQIFCVLNYHLPRLVCGAFLLQQHPQTKANSPASKRTKLRGRQTDRQTDGQMDGQKPIPETETQCQLNKQTDAISECDSVWDYMDSEELGLGLVIGDWSLGSRLKCIHEAERPTQCQWR